MAYIWELNETTTPSGDDIFMIAQDNVKVANTITIDTVANYTITLPNTYNQLPSFTGYLPGDKLLEIEDPNDSHSKKRITDASIKITPLGIFTPVVPTVLSDYRRTRTVDNSDPFQFNFVASDANVGDVYVFFVAGESTGVPINLLFDVWWDDGFGTPVNSHNMTDSYYHAFVKGELWRVRLWLSAYPLAVGSSGCIYMSSDTSINVGVIGVIS
jgi:hypothetical protein